MIISHLDYLEKSKVKVYIDGDYAFLLYQKDIKRFQLEEGKEISYKLHKEILEDTILRRAKQKAIAILKFMNRTEYELKKKLADAGYPTDIIEQVLTYVSYYDYVNDERYAASYIRIKKNTKSKLMLRMELLRKGIKKEMLEEALSNEYENDNIEDPEILAIKKVIDKLKKEPENLTWEEKQKIMASLYRKGFEIAKIKQVLY